jgi:hypothetical protein
LSPGQERIIDAEFALPDGTWPAVGQRSRLRPIDTGAVVINGPLERRALRRAFSALILRQSALRTTFRHLSGARAVQLVTAHAPSTTDRGALSFHEGGQPVVDDILRRTLAETVDPRHTRLFRGHLVHMREDHHVLLLQIHHLVSDGWSVSVLYRDLSALYTAEVRGEPADLPVLPVSFAEICRRMHRERGGAEERRQSAFWRERLAAPRPALRFSPRPALSLTAESHVDVERVVVPSAVVGRLRESARNNEHRGGVAGPFLSALAILLHHRTASTDIRVGMMIANRSRPDTEHLIGYFVNTVVVRLHIDPAQTTRQLVAAANVAVTEAIEHQTLPIQDLRHALREAGTPEPLYQVTVALNTMRSGSLSLAGLECHDLDVEEIGPKVAPTTIEQRWVLEERAGSLAGTLTYRTGTFTAAEIRDCLTDLDRALGLIGDAGTTVGDVLASLEPSLRAREGVR